MGSASSRPSTCSASAASSTSSTARSPRAAERPRRPRPDRLRPAQVLPARAEGLADDAAAAVRQRRGRDRAHPAGGAAGARARVRRPQHGPRVPRLPRRPAPGAQGRAARDPRPRALRRARLRHQVRDARPADRLPGHRAAQTGRITLPVPSRSGRRCATCGPADVPLDEVLDHLARVDAMLVAACDTPGLPDKPDVDAVDAFVVRAYRSAWDSAA